MQFHTPDGWVDAGEWLDLPAAAARCHRTISVISRAITIGELEFETSSSGHGVLVYSEDLDAWAHRG